MVNDSDWKDSLFILREESGIKLITFPKNMESFADNLFMISLVKLAVLQKWTIQLSSKELPLSVFETSEGAFFAGFISMACHENVGPKISGTTRYSKGSLAYQTYSVEKQFGKLPHLRIGGMDSLMSRLSLMKGFTKDYWSIRGSIAAILKTIKPGKVDDLRTFMLPKSEIMKTIRTKLPYENGGLFRTEEIAALNARYSNVSGLINSFVSKLDNPSEDLARNFQVEYNPVRLAVDKVEKEIKLLTVNRSKVLFPSGKKKSINKFKAKSLEEKLEEVVQNNENLFTPESLPGISREGESKRKPGTFIWKQETYKSTYSEELAKAIIDSWYANFSTEVEEDE